MRPTHSKFLALGATASAVALLAGACGSGGSSAGGSDAPCILTTQPARALSAGNCEAVFAQSAADEAWARLLGRDDHVNRGGRCDRHAGVGSAAGLRLREGVWGRHCPPHTLSLQEQRHRRHDRRRDG
ncbi:hypothetical protein [Cellulomonas flavigena]|uniref:hypothetical protein n=1 Tax=Cellulomonas flavigena TaxID=1711 RepID=UPI0009E65E6F|nr:hypothetical protein [Cellulomonas flavigena]